MKDKAVREYNIGNSDYSKRKIQPWDIWLEYGLDPWDADIIKRVLRKKQGESKKVDYQKIKHICDEKIRQIEEQEQEINPEELVPVPKAKLDEFAKGWR